MRRWNGSYAQNRGVITTNLIAWQILAAIRNEMWYSTCAVFKSSDEASLSHVRHFRWCSVVCGWSSCSSIPQMGHDVFFFLIGSYSRLKQKFSPVMRTEENACCWPPHAKASARANSSFWVAFGDNIASEVIIWFVVPPMQGLRGNHPHAALTLWAPTTPWEGGAVPAMCSEDGEEGWRCGVLELTHDIKCNLCNRGHHDQPPHWQCCLPEKRFWRKNVLHALPFRDTHDHVP